MTLRQGPDGPEFYAAIFAQIHQASEAASKEKLEHAIDWVRKVRDAWPQLAADRSLNLPLPHPSVPEMRTPCLAQAATAELSLRR